ncbi:unnamed protein product, partial [Closterium sp. Naga37s-1]
EMAEFFERNECASGVRECEKYMAVAMDHLVDEFRDALVKISKPLPAAMLREVAMSAHAGRLVDQHQGGAAAAAAAVLAGAAGPGVPRTSTGSSSASSHLPTSRSRTANTTSSPDSSGSSSPVGGGSAMAHVRCRPPRTWRCRTGSRCRAEAIQRSVDALDIKRVLTTSLEEMTWQQLEALYEGWVTDMRAMFPPSHSPLLLLPLTRLYFSSLHVCHSPLPVVGAAGSERVLCDEIFDSLEPDRELCYLSLIQVTPASSHLNLFASLFQMSPHHCVRLSLLIHLKQALSLLPPFRLFPPPARRQSGLAATVEAVVSNGRVVASGRNHTGAPLCAARHIEAVVSVPGFGSVLREMERLPRDLAGGGDGHHRRVQTRSREPPAHHQGAQPGQEERCECEQWGGHGAGGGDGGRHGATHHPHLLRRQLHDNLLDKCVVESSVVQMKRAIWYVRMDRMDATHGCTCTVVSRQSKRNYPVTLEYLLLEYGRSITSTGPPTPRQRRLITRSGPQYKTPFSGAAVERRSGRGGARQRWGSVGRQAVSGGGSTEWKEGQMLDKYMIHFRDAISHALEETAVTGGLLKSVNEHTEVKAKLKKFNTAFEELAIKQAGWNIPDEDRRKKTRSSVARRLREIYSAFLLPYREELCEFKTYRYSPDAIERVVLDYFFLATPSRGLPISFG